MSLDSYPYFIDHNPKINKYARCFTVIVSVGGDADKGVRWTIIRNYYPIVIRQIGENGEISFETILWAIGREYKEYSEPHRSLQEHASCWICEMKGRRYTEVPDAEIIVETPYFNRVNVLTGK